MSSFMDKAKNLGKAITGDKQDLSKVEGDVKQVTIPLPYSTSRSHVSPHALKRACALCCAASYKYLAGMQNFLVCRTRS